MEKRCVYCGKVITKESREHIIQNAIGGLEESSDICCSECNGFLSKNIDKPFVSIFNPIIAMIANFAKTNNTKSTPSYTGIASYDGEDYKVIYKNRKVVACPELSKKLCCDVSKLDFKPRSFDFVIENKTFLPGISKIAFNFAISKGIPLESIKDGLKITMLEERIQNIEFEYTIIPFVPLNPMDEYLELKTDLLLYHNLILFSQDNNLWCYIDLFNTFQYYVLLTDKWDSKNIISETYFQQIQKLDRAVPKINRWRPKYGLIYAQIYDVKPSPYQKVMQKRIEESIKKESLKKEMAKVLSRKLGSDYIMNYTRTDISDTEREIYGLSLLLYFDENDNLKEDTFRKVTLISENQEITSYPWLIYYLMNTKGLNVKNYAYDKFRRLNTYLINNENKKSRM